MAGTLMNIMEERNTMRRHGTGAVICAGNIEQMEFKIIIRRMGAVKSTGQMDTLVGSSSLQTTSEVGGNKMAHS